MSIEVKVSGSSKSLTAWFEESVNSVMGDVNDIVADAIEDGALTTQINIATRGTPKSGKQGRVRTGDMLDAVKSEMIKSTPREAEGKFGWIDEYEDYFGYQEGGFDHVGGVTVEGMYALEDAGEEAWNNVVEEIGNLK
jgi:hypothetical protein